MSDLIRLGGFRKQAGILLIRCRDLGRKGLKVMHGVVLSIGFREGRSGEEGIRVVLAS